MITFTEAAQTQLQQMLAQESDPGLMLRVFVAGGGCSGFQYGFTFDNTANDDDFRLPTSTPVVVDAMSMQYLQGATVHYRDDAAGAAFVIENPNATSTCGCGSSFSA
jgi:iron-sulfur cluster insertion protein